MPKEEAQIRSVGPYSDLVRDHDRPPIGVDVLILKGLSTLLGQISVHYGCVAIVKTKQELNTVSMLYVDMTECS